MVNHIPTAMEIPLVSLLQWAPVLLSAGHGNRLRVGGASRRFHDHQSNRKL